ncbi:PTS sugar transporter subunit IIC [Candidatus Latescibacterota bacterium]
METYLVLIIIAGIVAMDTTAGPQILVSEPIVSCSILGFLFGRPETGLMIGMVFQLLWLGYMPLGGVRFSDGNMGSFIATASLFTAGRIFDFDVNTLNAAMVFALFYSIIVSISGQHMSTVVHLMNGKRSDRLTARLEGNESLSITWFHLLGAGSSFLRGGAMALVLVPIGTLLCSSVLLMSAALVQSLARVFPVIWGTVFASAILLLWTKGKKSFLFIGFIGGFLWILLIISQNV